MITPRPYQLEAQKALFDCWRQNSQAIPIIVMPTGSGKAYQISLIIETIRKQKPDFRFLVVSHSKEIVEQDANEIRGLLNEPIGVYSAGLGFKTIRKITVAGVQSIWKRGKDLDVDMLICDENHRMNMDDETMYKKLVKGLYTRNPSMKVWGTSATPFRMDHGLLVGGFFTDICFDIHVKRLIADGYLSPIISAPSRGNLDFSTVERSGFDYKSSALEEKMSPLVAEHCEEILARSFGRRLVLIFCSGVQHAKQVAETMSALGESAEYISGEMLNMQRDLIIERFKSGETRILSNCEILTTGFNCPAIDCIALLRATRSAGLYVQIVGRGMRTSGGKSNCLVLDFGGNISRHGPIDCIEVKRNSGGKKAEIGCAPVKECPQCGAVMNIRVVVCSCGYEFPPATLLEKVPEVTPIISANEILEVDSVTYKIHNKSGKPPSLRIDYQCGIRTISDFLCFEHGGYAREKARSKWGKLGGSPALTVQEAFEQSGRLAVPIKIEVIAEGKFSRIIRILGFRKAEEPIDALEEFGVNI